MKYSIVTAISETLIIWPTAIKCENKILDYFQLFTRLTLDMTKVWISRPQLWWCLNLMRNNHGIMGRRFPDGGLLRYRKWVPQQLGDVNKQWSGDSRPIGARHGDTAANHTDLQSGCGQTCVFAVRVWSNLWELIWLRTSHYSMN